MDVETLATRENREQNYTEWLLCLSFRLWLGTVALLMENPAIVQMLWIGGR